MTTSLNQPPVGNSISRLVAAFARYGTRWYEADESYDLTSPAHVEALLLGSAQFRCRSYTTGQARAKAELIADAAVASRNTGWVGHPDNDPLETFVATGELSTCLRTVVEG